MLFELWEQILNYLDRDDILNIIKSKMFNSKDRLICNICSYKKQVYISDNFYVLEYIFDYCSGSYHLKSSTCGIYINGVCDHCSKVRAKLKVSQSAFLFHNFKDYCQIEKMLISNKKNLSIVSLPKQLLNERVASKYN